MTIPQTPPSLLHRLRDQPEDSEAWQRFVLLYDPLLSAWLRRHAIQDADQQDLLQDIFSAVFREMPTFKYDPTKGRFRGWLRAVLVNRVRHFWRSRPGREYHDAVLEQLEDERSSLARTWDREHDEHVLARLLEMVRPDFEATTWEAFRRVMLEGRDVVQVAEELALSVNAVRLAKSRVLKRLREEAAGLVD
jgi:RNA polymerase sigma-70 factor (ECF subfamily)